MRLDCWLIKHPDYFIGIDPGAKGGVVLLNRNGEIESALPFPKDSNKDTWILEDFFRDIWVIFALECSSVQIFIEDVHGRGGATRWGSQNVFNFGFMCGAIEMWWRRKNEGFHVIHKVQPQIWQRAMHKGISINVDAKKRSLIAARKLTEFPFTVGRGRTPHDGLVDAFLIAEYGRRYKTFLERK